MMIDENKNEMRRHRDVCFQDLDGKEEKNARRDGGKQQLGLGQLWRSLPKSCKIFLVVCVVQACVAGAFSVVELCKVWQCIDQDSVIVEKTNGKRCAVPKLDGNVSAGGGEQLARFGAAASVLNLFPVACVGCILP